MTNIEEKGSLDNPTESQNGTRHLPSFTTVSAFFIEIRYLYTLQQGKRD